VQPGEGAPRHRCGLVHFGRRLRTSFEWPRGLPAVASSIDVAGTGVIHFDIFATHVIDD